MSKAEGEKQYQQQKFEDFAEEAKDIVQNEVQNVLGDKEFNGQHMSEWTATVADNCVQKLQQLEKPFKYIVNCSVLQKAGAGYNTSSSCLWDAKVDGSFSVRTEFSTMYCIVAVYGIALTYAS
eukprot:gb/GECG01004099.1/.p1 GENE.gb/GECG01004099.1/~~gb/GECG01004099.1/.p1  ORF type:complete len:123 (+),score=22.74 gb/GECG01004099.1/:1-369(+)